MSDMGGKIAMCTLLFIFWLKKKLVPVFGMKRRGEDGLQMRKRHNKPERQDCSPDVTDHWGRNDHSCEDYGLRTCERENYWDKPKYNPWEEADYNEHQLNADVHTEYYSTYTHRNDRQNSKIDRKPFIQWGCKIYACIIIAALFLFVVAFNVF